MNTIRPNYLLTFSLILASLFGSIDAMATHLVGGSLNYEYLGENIDGTYRYRIYSVTYTDCGPTSNFQDPEAIIPIAIYENDLDDPNADKVLVTEFNMPLISFEEVVLAGLPSGCDVGSDICLEEGTYEFFVDLPLNFDGYWIYYDRCCRNDAVVNLTELQGVGMSTYIPSPLIENSSPFFNTPPTPFLCAGDTSSFLNSAIDPDGDLMVFSFINPFAGYSSQAIPNPGAGGYDDPMAWEVPTTTYNPGFSVSEPFGAAGYAFINGATGLSSYMVPAAGQYAIAIEIKEYRNGNLIGITRRDLQLTVINCPVNPSPDLDEASQGNVGITDWEIDEGETLCFPVIFVDENGDSLTLVSFGEVFDPGLVLPTATINTPQADLGTVQADFCWETDCTQGQLVPYQFQVSASDNGCPPKTSSEAYTILVVPFTGATMLDGESSVCANSTETYETDLMVDAEYLWVATGGTITGGQGTNEVTVDWGAAGVGSLTVTITNFRGCVGDAFDLEVAITPLPIISAGADISICAGDTVTIGGAPTGPGGSFFIWGPDENITETNIGNPGVFPTEDTDYEVQVISANSCSARDTITVSIFEPLVQVTDDQEICSGQSAQLLAFDAVSYTWTPTMTLDNPNVPDPIATPTTTTTYTAHTVDSNNCEADSDITITVFEQPVAAAGADQVICGLMTELEAIPSSGTATWTPVGDGIVSGNNANATASALTEGVYEFIWEETTGSGLCTSSDMVSIEFIAQPVAEAGSGSTVCGLTTDISATPSVGVGLWNIPAGLNYVDNSAPAGSVTADDYGSYTLTWSESNQTCSDSEEITLVFVEQPVANAGLDDAICGDIYVTGAASTVGSGMWDGPAGITFDDETLAVTSLTTTVYGAQVLTWTEDNGNGCVDSQEVVITFTEQPVANAGADQSICGLVTDAEAVASVGTSVWSPDAGLSLVDLADGQTTITADDYGVYTLTWTELEGSCTDSDEVTITFLEVPVADAGLDEDLCIESSLDLSATGGGTYTWSPSEGLDDPSSANPEANPTATTTYEVLVELDNGCTDIDEVTITVNPLPVIDAGEDVGYLCYGDSVQLQPTPGFASYSWSPNSNISDTDIANPYVGPLPQDGAIITYTVTVTDDNNCVNADILQVTINPDVPTDAGNDTIICQGEPVILGAFPVSPDGTTYLWSPDSNIDDVNIEHPTVTPTQTTTYLVQTDNSICTGSDQVTVVVEETPEVFFSISATPACTGLNVMFDNLGDNSLSYIWYFGDGDSSVVVSPSHLYPFSAQYTVTLVGESDQECLYEVSEVLDATDFASYFDITTPNVMTPNGDGDNDVLDINVSGQIEECLQMEVFNRWGQLLFQASGNNTRWDGRTIAGEIVEPGVYFYFVEFNGFTHKGSVQVLY